MPKELDDCVKALVKKGHSKPEAYGICCKETGWVKKKGGGWKNKKTGKTSDE